MDVLAENLRLLTLDGNDASRRVARVEDRHGLQEAACSLRVAARARWDAICLCIMSEQWAMRRVFRTIKYA